MSYIDEVFEAFRETENQLKESQHEIDFKVAVSKAKINSTTEAFDFLKTFGAQARAEILLDAVEPGSFFAQVIPSYEYRCVMAQGDVAVYANPSNEELRDVLEATVGYDGIWYHSCVEMIIKEEWSPWEQKVVNLPDSAGVYRIFLTEEEAADRYEDYEDEESGE